MQMIKGKAMAILIALFLTMSMGASTIVVPTAIAHSPPLNIQLFAFCNVAPNPVGVGQSVNVGFWLNEPPMTASGPFGDRYGPFTVHVTLPDGTKTTLGPFTSDDTGGTHTQYTPSEVGTYTFQMTYPGQVLTGQPTSNGLPSTSAFVNDTILPATSNIATLTVQQASIVTSVGPPLPISYWQTPINAMNVGNWYVIGGASLDLGGTGKYNYS